MYKSTNWLDRVVDAGSGEVIQEGTDQSAANFNNMEGGIGDSHLAIALMQMALANNSNRLKVLEATLTHENDHNTFKWPDGFNPNNTIIVPVATFITKETGNWTQYFYDTNLNGEDIQNSISFKPNDNEIGVSFSCYANTDILVRLLLFKYK